MGTKLFVGGLSWDTTDNTLGAFFAGAGKVVSANVIIDRMTGRSKGFGFVEMASEEDAKKALALNGQALDGRNIAVSEARPQQPRDFKSRDQRGGGNSGGGQRRSWR
jgi:cold-inducible RNA-binding protein